MKIFRLLLMLCGMLFTGIGFADEIDGMRFTHIGLEDGLSHSTIFGINQDKEVIYGLPPMTALINTTVIILRSIVINTRIPRV